MAVAAKRQFGDHVVTAVVRVGNKAVGAVVGPVHRAPEFAGNLKDTVICGLSRLLHYERAADVLGQDPDLVAADAKNTCHVIAGNGSISSTTSSAASLPTATVSTTTAATASLTYRTLSDGSA
jgi:hypothetical protein